MPYEGQPGAYWALLGPDVGLRHTWYDVKEAARRITATGFPAAEEFSRENVLASPSPEDAIETFEAISRR
jgi:hypothetical protein